MFERLREALDALLDSATPVDRRGIASRMHEAVVETRAAIHGLRDGLAESEKKLARERTRLADAERRGGLARGIDDSETAAIADQYAAKHREHVNVLEQKVLAQRHEIELAERELGEMKVQLRRARDQRGMADDTIDQAWQSIESAGGEGVEDDLLRGQFDRAAREAAAEDKLEEMKRKMGR